LVPVRHAAGEGAVLGNPGMEGAYRELGDGAKVSGQVATGWSDNSDWADVQVAYAGDPAQPHGGSQSQRITIDKVQSGAVQFVQTVKLAKNREYTVKAWLRGTAGSSVTLMLRRLDGAYKEYASATVTLTPEWREHAVTGVVDEDAAALLMVRAVAPLTVWVDDMELTATEWNAALVPLKNPGLEVPYTAVGASSGPGQISGETASGWGDNSNWADVTVAYAQDGADPHRGQSAQRIAVSGVRSGAVQFKQNVMLKKDRIYAMSVWLRGSPGSMVSLLLRETGGASKQYAGTTASLSAEWREYRVFGRCTDDTEGLLMIRLTSPTTIWVDDTRLEDVTDQQAPEPADDNMLRGGSMEGLPGLIGAQSGPGQIRGEIVEGWGDNSGWADVTVAYAPDRENPHGGQAAQRVSVEGVRSGVAQFVHGVNLRKDHVYALSMWLRGSAGSMVAVALREKGGSYEGYAGLTAALTPEWKEFKVVGRCSADVEALVMLKATAPLTYWVDDVRLVDVTGAQSGAAARGGNLLSGGSFEAGVSFGWSARTQGYAGNRYGDPRARMDSATAAHGASSLRIDIPARDYTRISSPVFTYAAGRPHTASLWMKASVAHLSVQGEIENTGLAQGFDVGTEWKAYSWSGALPFLPFTRMKFTARAPEGQAVTLWIDGVQLEEGATASASYRAPYPSELTLQLARPGSVVFDGESASVAVRLVPAAPEGATLKLSAVDIYGKAYAVPSVALPADALTLPAFAPRARGVFKLRAEAVDAAGVLLAAPVEMVWARLPRPREDVNPRESFFGLHLPLAPDHIAMARAVGTRQARLHDASMTAKWAIAEPEPGKWEFHDEGVTAAHEAGLSVLGLLDGAPAWTSTKPREGGYWGVWNIPDKPEALPMWENYVRTVATHYQGRIDDWEVWNEPWGNWFLGAGGKPELYGQLTRSAYRILKEVNPDGRLIGIDGYRGHDDWNTNALAATGIDAFDALSFHDYNDAIYGGPENMAQIQAKQFRDFQRPYGEPKPLWNTEGGSDMGSFYVADTGGVPIQLQPTYIVRYDVCHMGAGVKAFHLYAAHCDCEMGEASFLVTEHDRAVRPVIAARAVLAHLVDGLGAPVRTEPVPGVDQYTFVGGAEGREVRVVWSFDGATHTLPVPKGLRVLDVFGNAVVADGGNVTVVAEPQYLVRGE